jgi:hypothetical protein
MTGYVFYRTQEYAARQRGEAFERYTYATAVTVELSPLPCWRHLSSEQRKIRVAGLLRDIEAEAAAERKATGKEVLGAEAVTSVDPQHRPEKLDRSPAPRFHAYTREAWFMLWETYSWFMAAFRTAAGKLKAGDRAAPFPTGSFSWLEARRRGWAAPVTCTMIVADATIGGRRERRWCSSVGTCPVHLQTAPQCPCPIRMRRKTAARP